MNTGKILFSAVVGAIIGVAVGMLYAPAKGSATRRKILKSGAGYADDVKDTFDKYIDTMADEFDTIKDAAADFVDKGKKKAVSLAGTANGK